MKRFYTFVAAVAACAAVCAAAPVAKVGQFEAATLRHHAPYTADQAHRAPAKAPLGAPADGWEVVGTTTYSDGLMTYDYQSDFEYGATWEVSLEKSGDWYRFVPYNENSPIAQALGAPDDSYLYINATDPDKVYCEDFTAYGEFYYFNLVPESQIIGSQITADDACYGKVVDGSVIFPMNGFVSLYDEQFVYCDAQGLMAFALPDKTLRTSWTELGTTSFTEGILSAMYQVSDNVYDIEVDENYFSKGYYRLRNAWGHYFNDGISPSLVVDLTDPEYGLAAMTFTGLIDSADGATFVVSQSYAYAYFNEIPVDKEGFLSKCAEYNITLKDGVVTFPANSFFFVWPNANPTGGTNPGSFYLAQSGIKSSFALPVSASVNEIDASLSVDDTRVEYFNLQGVRVAEPSNGLFIRRRGGKSSKVVIR